jgi:nitrogen fixation protein FixH
MMANSATLRPVTGKHVLFGILGFFGFVMSVNAVFIVAAVSTFDGLESPKAYDEGRAFNQTIAAAKAQGELGWTLQSRMTAPGLEVRLADAHGQPVRGLKVEATLWRPVHEGEDQALSFTEVAPGSYLAPVGALGGGQWELRLETMAPGGVPVRVRERMHVEPRR